MYEFIMWMCLTSAPACPVYQSANHNMVLIIPFGSKKECEDYWKASLAVPDPEGMKSYHKCEAVGEDL